MNERDASILAKSVAAECIAFRVRLLNRVITNIYDRALQPLGIKVNQANILVMLTLIDRASSADIAKVLSMEKSTVSRTLDRMKNNGWISIAGNDGPSQVVSVTSEGRKIMATAHIHWKKAQKQASEVLGEKGVAAVMMLHNTLKQGKK